MDTFDRERLAARLISGRERLLLNSDGGLRSFGLRPPTPFERHIAAEAAAQARAEATLEGVLSEAEVLSLLEKRGLWTQKDAHEYKTALENVDKLKVGMYLAKTSREVEVGRKTLDKTRALLRVLSAKRNEGRDKTLEQVAEGARIRAMIGMCLEREDGSPAFPRGYASDCSSLLDAASAAYAQSRASEAELRELARTEPWRSVWGSREACGGSVFPAPSSHLTDEQRLLVVWTRMYDNAAQDSDGPTDEVVADDDLFDGWMIHRRRSREDEASRRVKGLITNEKIANSNEVFVIGAAPGEAVSGLSPEELAAAERLNSPEAARLKAQRNAQVMRKGALHEAELTDVNQHLQAELHRMAVARAKGTG